jgi:hypothetical protein
MRIEANPSKRGEKCTVFFDERGGCEPNTTLAQFDERKKGSYTGERGIERA